MSIGPFESYILTLLFFAAPILLAVLFGRWLAGVVRDAVRSEVQELGLNAGTVLEILDERYARGEIGREEYERMRRELVH